MARNEEKALAMSNVYLRRHEIGRIHQTRPVHTHFVTSVEECQKWLNQIISEITQSVSLIQSPQLGETKIRETNDNINKLLKERRYWEKRIIELGGFEYAEKIGINCQEERRKKAQQEQYDKSYNQAILTGDLQAFNKRQRHQQYMQDRRDKLGNSNDKSGTSLGTFGKNQTGKSRNINDGEFSGQIGTTTKTLGIEGNFDSKDVIGVDGYFYFGAAKSLPGVRELYEQSKVQETLKVQKKDLKKRADANYFGYTEDYDHQLLRDEMEMETIVLQKMLQDEEDALNGNGSVDNDVVEDEGENLPTMLDENKLGEYLGFNSTNKQS
jgi:pre-mRNA-splicing factor ISY1